MNLREDSEISLDKSLRGWLHLLKVLKYIPLFHVKGEDRWRCKLESGWIVACVKTTVQSYILLMSRDVDGFVCFALPHVLSGENRLLLCLVAWRVELPGQYVSWCCLRSSRKIPFLFWVKYCQSRAYAVLFDDSADSNVEKNSCVYWETVFDVIELFYWVVESWKKMS